MNSDKMIGIVGGVGPYAGLDLARKIFDQTIANSDQEHLPIALLSMPEQVGDRTSFLLGKTEVNPAYAISKIIRQLDEIGASVAGIACNSVHSPEIFDVILEELDKTNGGVKLLHMINEVAEFIQECHPKIRNVGVLCTTGTYKTKVYTNILEPRGFGVILPDEVVQENFVHKAIYDPKYGIKAQSNPVTAFAKEKLSKAIGYLQKERSEAIVLGCTELPLAITTNKIGQTFIIDPALIFARALIRQVKPNKLKPLTTE